MYPWLTGGLTVERVTVPITDLPAELVGITLVQLSDFHFDGLRLSPRLLAAAIAASNHLQPDLVMLTGDYVTKDPAPIHGLALYLKQLQSRYGVYGVLGNHDDITPQGRQEIQSALQGAGVKVLWNAITYPLGPGLPLVGLADLWSGPFVGNQLLAQLPVGTPRLVLAHNPDTTAQWQGDRVDLQLSGHTHGGQVVLPGLGPLPPLVRRVRPYLPQWVRRTVPYLSDHCDRVTRHWEWAAGLHRVGETQLYVNRGLGTYLPGRLRCSPEVTHITLVAA